MSLSTKILAGLVAGIAAGIVVGEPLGVLAPAGDAFIRLLQMTVLPYVVVSLISGFGHLDIAQARRLGLWGGGLLLLLWGIAFVPVAVMPLAFPRLQTASFYSTTLVESAPRLDLIELYIPANPFHALANNVVPAVVVFSLALGVALMTVPERGSLLRGLEALRAALLKVNEFVVRLTPIGVFCLGASAAGTMTVSEFQRVQVYLISYALFALISTFWLLPGLLSVLTPVRHRDALVRMRDALITSFATGSSFVVIPLVARASKQLLAEHAEAEEDGASVVDVLVPASHTFPHSAKVLTLSFVLFAGWSMDARVPLHDYPLLALSGIASTFGSVIHAIPFLLDLMRLPHDLTRLFLATSVVNARFGTLLQTMHVLVLTVLTTAALTGCWRLRWKPLLRYALTSSLVLTAAVLGTRVLFATVVDTTYRGDQLLGRMQLSRGAVPAIVHREPPAPIPPRPGVGRLGQILDRDLLRVCYRSREALPFSYFNDAGELVGLDVEMAHSLAQGLEVALELVPVDAELSDGSVMARNLAEGYCDIVMSGSVMSMDTVTEVAFSKPYLELNLGFLVRDHRRNEFQSRSALQDRDDLRIAFPNDRYYLQRMAGLLPHAELVPVESVREFLDEPDERFDAFAYIAEAASAWSLLYPRFDVVVPEPGLLGLPLAYELPAGDSAWRHAVDAWLELKRADGTVEQLYDYWILGLEAVEEPPRWSVLRDVLGWFE